MDVSIIIVNYNGLPVIQECLHSLQKLHADVTVETIVVDNASEDNSVAQIRNEFPALRIIEQQTNEGFGSACNNGAKHASGRYLFFLNPDTLVKEDILTPLVKFLDTRADVGIVGPKIVNDDGTVQLSCGKLPSIVREAVDKITYSSAKRRHPALMSHLETKYSIASEVEWVTGAALMVGANLFQLLGGFDARMFMYFEDKDLCKRAREQGFHIWFYPACSVLHHLGKSSKGNGSAKLREIYRMSQRYYYSKHHGVLQQWLLKLYQGVSS